MTSIILKCKIMKNKELALQIFLAGVERVKPENLIKGILSLENNILTSKEYSFPLQDYKNIYIAGTGKASAGMAKAIEEILGDRITGGILSTKYGHSVPCNKIKIIEAGHPYPDENSVKAANEIYSLCKKADEKDLILFLLSGGGSALLADFDSSISLTEYNLASKFLVNSGASIEEINTIRKHIGTMKGGQLTKTAYPARLISLILSDVIGDPLDVIASGLTVPDSSTKEEALSILKKYQLQEKFPESVISILNLKKETPKAEDPVFHTSTNIIIGNIKMALESSASKAEELGFQPVIVTDCLQGDVLLALDFIFQTIEKYQKPGSDKKTCLLFGGETTIKINSSGKGGRNQHLALLAADRIKDQPGITILAAGTDGTDGPTNAAGAVVDFQSCKNKNPEEFISNFDSYHFFQGTEDHILTGPTGTNVMDMVLLLI